MCRPTTAILNLHERIENKLFLDRTRKDSNFKRPYICATLFQIEKCWPDDPVLAILCRNGNTRQNIRRILARVAELDPAARSDATARLVILAQLRRAVVEEVATMGNITFDIKDHPVLNDIFEKGVLEGEARGEARGRSETLLRLLRRRYGTVPDAIIDRIHAAGNDDLDQWTDAVLDAPSLDAVFEPSKH
jgi:hypothetical protein